MRVPAPVVYLAALGAILAVAACGQGKAPTVAPPDWAYPQAAPGPMPVSPSAVNRVPGSALALSAAQVTDELNPPDWNPEEHPAPPAIVAHGRPGGPIPCGECHLVGGQGFIGTPDLAGLPADYIIAQVRAFRADHRISAVPGHTATAEMIRVAKTVSDPELASAAAYFSSLPRRRWFRVVETETVPVTRPNAYGWLDLVSGGGTEPIKGRIIEVPEDTRRTFLEDPHSGVVVYVPTGSIARGQALAKSGGAGGQACTSCHGPNLQGQGAAPPLAGRSSAYLARMLWDIKTGARKGPAVAQMQGPAGGLSPDDITDVVAYLTSRQP